MIYTLAAIAIFFYGLFTYTLALEIKQSRRGFRIMTVGLVLVMATQLLNVLGVIK